MGTLPDSTICESSRIQLYALPNKDLYRWLLFPGWFLVLGLAMMIPALGGPLLTAIGVALMGASIVPTWFLALIGMWYLPVAWSDDCLNIRRANWFATASSIWIFLDIA